MRLRNRATALAAGTAITAVTAGVAFGLWSATGSGNGSATTATAKNLTVTASAADAGLYPGGPTGAVGFTVANDNAYPVKLTGVSYGAVDAGGACDVDDMLLAGDAPKVVNITVPAKGSVSSTIPGVLGLASTAGDECQGVPLTVDLAFTGAQQ